MVKTRLPGELSRVLTIERKPVAARTSVPMYTLVSHFALAPRSVRNANTSGVVLAFQSRCVSFVV